jgi:hypothetical protein
MSGVSLGVLLTALAIPLPGAQAGRPLTAPQPGGPTLDLDTILIPPFCAGPLQVQGVEAVVCEFPVNWVFDETDLAQFATSSWGVTIQAVGGNGGDGGSSLGGTVGGGAGGAPGLAQATLRGDALAGRSLYIYVGNNGSFGAPGNGGSGGAATVVATARLGPTVESLEPDVLVVAGGGGGGQGYAGSLTCVEDLDGGFPAAYVGCPGGDGGVAIGIDESTRMGFARLGAGAPFPGYTPPYNNWTVFNLGAGQPARFDAGAWIAGAGGSGGSDGAAAFSFAGAPGMGSAGTWVRETSVLTLGDVIVLGGQGAGTGGGGGGGVAGGGGAGNAGGAGGASYAVSSGQNLDYDGFTVPCDPMGFCATNWLSPAATDQPTVVITFWVNHEADPVIPSDGEVIDTDQPSVVFNGANASAGIQYLLEDPLGELVNYSGLINGSATGNFLWTVPAGLLGEGQTYNWYVTDQAGNPLQGTQSFTVATGTSSSGSTLGWTLYVRSILGGQPDLSSADLKPLGNQPPLFSDSQCTSCGCESQGGCYCDYDGISSSPTASTNWVWDSATGPNCTASSGSCYANAQVHIGTIDIDWASTSNPLGLQVPSSLINVTTEPPSPTDGSPVPSLTVPDIAGVSGNCTNSGLPVPLVKAPVEVTFTARTNGGIRFQVYADPETGDATITPSTAIDYWSLPGNAVNCVWQKKGPYQDKECGSDGSNWVYSPEYIEEEVMAACQASVAEQTGNTFCLTPGTPYRVRFDAVQPYLPGPMELGFKLPGMDSGAPIPANWVSTCTLDSTTGNCSTTLTTDLGGPPAHSGPPDRVGPPDHAGRPKHAGTPQHAGSPKSGRPTLEAPASPGEGAAGADSCTAVGSTVSCIWTENGTWALPSAYTQPGGWITVQALGGQGGDGPGGAGNAGGAAGRAQATVPADSLANSTLYAYVGDSGVTTSDYKSQSGGAASLVTTSPVPASFVSNGCLGGPGDIDALVIAGGGGGGGYQSSGTGSDTGIQTPGYGLGGAGGIAVGLSDRQESVGSGSPGTGGNHAYGGQPPAYGSNPFDGAATVAGGYGENLGSAPIALGGGGYATHLTWLRNSESLSLAPPGDGQIVCGGGTTPNFGGGGGGGHAGGGGSTIGEDNVTNGIVVYTAGGGGGSSWASPAGTDVYIPPTLRGWRALASNEPSQVVITVECPDCFLLSDCAMQNTTLRPVMRCTLTQSAQAVQVFDLGYIVGELIGQEIGAQVPVYLEAWGGHGGTGGEANSGCAVGAGGAGGGPGYARTSHTFGSLGTLASELWLYVGGRGGDGPGNQAYGGCPTTYAPPGAGGASTLILSEPLTGATALDDVLVIAAGGGGGGQGRAGLDFGYDGKPGNSGGTAVASTSGAASAGGVGGASAKGNGKGACGLDPLDPGSCGTDGVGGRGGGVDYGAGTTGWVGISSSWSDGQGGHSKGGSKDGGAGGGGYGGGEAGGSGTGSSGGGGAGGSYAVAATLSDSGAPVLGAGGSPSSTNGAVVITFDVCSTYPTLSVCQP